MTKLSFDDWIKSRIEKDFTSDFKKIKRIKRDGLLVSGSLIFIILIFVLAVIIDPKTNLLKSIFRYSLIASLILPFIFTIKTGFNFKRKLSVKEFIICLLEELGRDIKQFSKEQETGEKEAKNKIKILKRVLNDEFTNEGFNFESIINLKKEIYNLAKYLELKINKNEIDNQADSIFLRQIASDIYNESTPQKIINEITAKHKYDFGINEMQKSKFNNKYFIIGIIFTILIVVGILLKIDKNYLFGFSGLFMVSIVFVEILKSKN